MTPRRSYNMNGIEKITSRIEAEARAEADGILEEARAMAERIKTETGAKAQERYWELIRAGVKETEQRIRRLDAAAQMEARKSVLSLKQELVTWAFDRACELILELPREEYIDFLARQAASAANAGAGELIFNEKDSAIAGEVLKRANALLTERGVSGQLKLSAETRQMLGGLILKEGNVEVNCTIETLTALCRNEMSTQVAEAMFD